MRILAALLLSFSCARTQPAAPPAPVTAEAAPAAPAAEPAPAARPVSTYTGPDPCKHATEGDSPVARACAEGGIKQAKAAMKDMVRQGKAQGVRFDCDDCHADDSDYAQLTGDAHEKFEKLLAVVKR